MAHSLPEGTTLGQHVVLGQNITLGKRCAIGNNVVIHDDTIIADDVRVDDNTVIGKHPMRAARSATTSNDELPGATIGQGSMIGACTVIYRGANIGRSVLIADQASIRERVTIGDQTIIGRGVYLENKTVVGARCKIEANAYITAFSVIGDDCFIAPGVLTSNDNYAGRDAERHKHFKGVTVEHAGRIGVGAVILPGKTIGRDALVAAGAVVTADVPPATIVVGAPAKPARAVPDKQRIENQ